MVLVHGASDLVGAWTPLQDRKDPPPTETRFNVINKNTIQKVSTLNFTIMNSLLRESSCGYKADVGGVGHNRRHLLMMHRLFFSFKTNGCADPRQSAMDPSLRI